MTFILFTGSHSNPPTMVLRNTDYTQCMHTCGLYKARAALGPGDHSSYTCQRLHAATFTEASVHTPYCSTQTSVDATRPLRKAVLTNLTTPDAVASSLCDPGHSYAERTCDIPPRLRSTIWHQAVLTHHSYCIHQC